MESERYLECLENVDALFINWKLHFGAKLKNRQELDLNTARLWAAALVLLNADDQELEGAFAVSITRSWPPTTPADYLELVRGNYMSQYPESYTAYIQAANGRYLHPVCYETAVRVGLWKMRSESEHVTRKLWEEFYKIVCIEHSEGVTFPVSSSNQIENKNKNASISASDSISADYINKITLLLSGKKR